LGLSAREHDEFNTTNRFKVERTIEFSEQIERCDAVIRVYDEPGNVIETHDHKGDFKEP
jgi:hypothetical protein